MVKCANIKHNNLNNKMFKRLLEAQIKKEFFLGKAIIVVGPRQVGKTTLIENMLKVFAENNFIKFNCDYSEDREILNEQSLKKIEKIIGVKKIVFIDEGQKVHNIGNTLKILVDYYKNTKQIIVTGSSSINLLDKTAEPLTGRKRVYKMYPISCREISLTYDNLYLDKHLGDLLIFGQYPGILNLTSYEEKIKELSDLAESSLYKDILEFQGIKNSSVITKLLKALALQIGSEVSLNKIGGTLGIDSRAVEKYIDILEKSYIIFRLQPYFTNKRKELSKMNKVFFFDLGVRNAVINNFNFLDSRNDVGQLFENFVILEKMKIREYGNISAYQYFWKDYNGKEIDLLEEYGGILHAYEIKWSRDKDKIKIPGLFQKMYKDYEYNVINQKNYLDFLV